MLRRSLLTSVAALFIVVWAAPVLSARDLTFDERVRAQTAIERVYYAHRIDASQPFEEAVPIRTIEKKVRTYLQLSVALERRWGTRLNGELLEREVARMARSSRMPERLRELFAALGDDAFLVQECLARPALVDRLARGLFAPGGNMPELSWDAWWADASLTFDATAAHAVAASDTRLPPIRNVGDSFAPESVCDPDDTWINGSLDDVPEGNIYHTAVWTGSVMIVWGGNAPSTNKGSRYDPALDSWSSITTIAAPTARAQHTAVWTGRVMVVWGGPDPGGRYDPDADKWAPVATSGAPQRRLAHAAVWTGSRMIVWGGHFGTILGDGGRYDPETDVWTPVTTVGAPAPRTYPSAVWTGAEMIVWGGSGSDGATSLLNTGGRYNPVNDTWAGTSTNGAPVGRRDHTAVWTGSRMIVWGGRQPNSASLATGGVYDPASDTWTSTSTINAPGPRASHTAVWTGSRMVVWGGGNYVDTGGRYDPITDVWSPTSMLGTPLGRTAHTAVWTGSQMIVWGGLSFNQGLLNSGGRYDPGSDVWTTTTATAPRFRAGHTAVWTGNLMIVWGGYGRGSPAPALNTGDRYDPAIGTWTPTSVIAAPQARSFHTAVWTGSRMIVWGGGNPVFPASYFNTGARYDPTSDVWTPMSTANAPTGRRVHTAVWTGHAMIVWGGSNDVTYFDSGGRYDPAGDTWLPTATSGAPQPRVGHRAVWTGNQMIVWGGAGSTALYGTGGRYDPLADSWTATSTVGSQPPVRGHTAIWTGTDMLVWGGDRSFEDIPNPEPTLLGRLYDPVSDHWKAVNTVGAPFPRSGHSAVWTGRRMIVWGGTDLSGYSVNTGGAYVPATSTWEPTAIAGAPTPTSTHTAVWTGRSMTVWGGNPSGPFGTGGSYALDQGVDNDGDGQSACSGDCDDTDAMVFDKPHEVHNLRWLDPQTLSWDSDAANSGLGTRYDVMLGDLGEVGMPGAPGDGCLYDGLSATSVSNPTPAPTPGTAWFLLVRGDNTCGKGRWTTRTDGTDRPTTACP